MSRQFDARKERPSIAGPPTTPITYSPQSTERTAMAPLAPRRAREQPQLPVKSAQDAGMVRAALDFASSLGSTLGLGDASSFTADAVQHTSAGAGSVNLQHQYLGIPVFESSMIVRFDPDGTLRDAASNVAPETVETAGQRSVSVLLAAKIAAEYVATPHPDEFNVPDQFGETVEPPQVDVRGFRPTVLRPPNPSDPTQTTTFERGPFGDDITASLVWFVLGERSLLAWSIQLTLPDHLDAYQVSVGAGTGRVLYCRSQNHTIAAAGWVYRANGEATRELVAFPPPWNDYAIGAAAIGQSGWSRCSKCGALVLTAAMGTCPAGGRHQAVPQENYSVVRNSPRYPGEPGWRCCARCAALYSASLNGVCADGHPHVDRADGNYIILKDAPLSIGSSGCRRCSRCAALVGPSQTVWRCFAGGTHDVVQSPYYTLPRPSPMPATPRDWVGSVGASGYCTVVDLVGSSDAPVGEVKNGVVIFNPTNATGPEQIQLNLFYYCCYMHDLTYLLGFREADGNFQLTNYGLGGTDGDPVIAHAYSGQVPSTASMLTKPDGQSPVMKMGLVTSSGRHTALDATVVFHEYFHGVSNRLVGGPANTTALTATHSAGMGEGWSDFVACALCGVNVVAAWVLNTHLGIRRYPYNAQFPDAFGALGTGRYLYEPHNIGEIWAAALMEMARRTDRDLALQLVMDALKLTKPQPSFLDGRDAIIVALHNLLQAGHLNQGQHDGAWLGIWLAFAKFGMGPAAASSGALTDRVVADTSIGESGWRRCRVCAGIFRPDSPSVCRNAQPHVADATFPPYEIVVNRPNYPGESGWLACGKCGQLHLPGHAGGSGNCWTGGTHTAANRGIYSVLVNAVGSAGEPGWRRCVKCDSLYFSGSASVPCPGGSSHVPATSVDYRLIAKR